MLENYEFNFWTILQNGLFLCCSNENSKSEYIKEIERIIEKPWPHFAIFISHLFSQLPFDTHSCYFHLLLFSVGLSLNSVFWEHNL